MATFPPLPVSGWLDPTGGLSSASREEICRRFPLLPISRVQREVGYYLIEREAFKTNPDPKEVREIFDRLETEARSFTTAIMELERSPAGSYIRQASYHAGHYGFQVSLKASLEAYLATITKAKTMLPRGRRRGLPLHGLVRRLGHLLKESGLPLSTTASGPLCQLTAIVLEGLGERHADVRRLVGDAFGDRRKRAVGPARGQLGTS